MSLETAGKHVPSNKIVDLLKLFIAMKKIALLLCLMLTSFSYMIAQDAVRGKVIDRDGNPIPGVKVEIVGKPISVITEIDGSFTIPTDQPLQEIRVVYSGMQTKVLKATPDMVITMSKTTWWNRVPDKYSWIISPQFVVPENGASNPSYGLMVARVKTLGYYAKFVFSPTQGTNGDYVHKDGIDGVGIDPWTTGKDKRSYIAGTAGVMYRLKSAIHAYAGLGYVNRVVAWQIADESWLKNTEYSYSGVVLDYGLLLRCGHFTVNGGAMMSLSGGCNFAANVGIGYSF